MLRQKIIQLSLSFITVVIIAGLLFLGYFFEITGLVSWTGNLHQILNSLNNISNFHGSTNVPSNVVNTQVNTREYLPTDLIQTPIAATNNLPTNTSVPTSTPIAPLDMTVYETTVTSQLRSFAFALNHWLDLNQLLLEDSSYFNDQRWQDEMRQALLDVQEGGESLAKIGPPPPDYKHIDVLLDSVKLEANNLVKNYQDALDHHDPAFIVKSGLNFASLKDYLRKAVEEMIAQGWNLNKNFP